MAIKYLPYYNVSASVGKFGANKPDDVTLVQFFLTEVAKVPPQPLPPPTTPLPINGMPSDALVEWILWFQKSVQKAGKQVVVDGRIDPGKAVNSDIYGGFGTMTHLNGSYRRRFKQNHNNLETASNCPGVLRPIFASDDFA